MISDSDFADATIERLNVLVKDERVREDICRLIENRILVCEQTAAHPSIQVQTNAAGDNILGFLGLLNGIIGTLPDGKLRGVGYVAAVFNDAGQLERFRRTDVEAAQLVDEFFRASKK